MKTSEILTRLWDLTSYYQLAEPGKKEAKIVMQLIEKTLEIFSVFHHSLQSHFNRAESQRLSIPAMQCLRDQVMQSKANIARFVPFNLLSWNKRLIELVLSSSDRLNLSLY